MGIDEAFLLMADEDRLVKAVRDAADRLQTHGGTMRYLDDEEDWD